MAAARTTCPGTARFELARGAAGTVASGRARDRPDAARQRGGPDRPIRTTAPGRAGRHRSGHGVGRGGGDRDGGVRGVAGRDPADGRSGAPGGLSAQRDRGAKPGPGHAGHDHAEQRQRWNGPEPGSARSHSPGFLRAVAIRVPTGAWDDPLAGRHAGTCVHAGTQPFRARDAGCHPGRRSDAPADARSDTGTHTGPDTRSDTGTHTGPDTRSDTGTHTGPDTRSDTGPDARAHARAHRRRDPCLIGGSTNGAADRATASVPPGPTAYGRIWRSAKRTLAGRSASRRMYHGYQCFPYAMSV